MLPTFLSLILIFPFIINESTFNFPGIDDVLALIEQKEEAVGRICDKVNLYYSDTEKSTDCKRYEACDKDLYKNNPVTFTCTERFGSDSICGCSSGEAVVGVYPIVRYAPETDKTSQEINEFVCFTESIKTVFIDNYDQDPGLAYQYIGSPTGAFNRWPGKSDFYSFDHGNDDKCMELDKDYECPEYDPRLRPWYVAAASDPKDVILLIDVSSSMNKGTPTGKRRIELAKEAAKDILKGLGIQDRLAIVKFSVIGETCSFAGDNLLEVNSENAEKFEECIDLISPISDTNFEDGFSVSFDILKKRTKLNCHTVILFLTDGEATVGKQGSDFLDFVREKNNDDVDAKIFSFALSEDADTVIPKKLACENKGTFNLIIDGYSLREKMSDYYRYFSYSEKTRGKTWSEAYEDFTGLGWMVTVAQGCFSESNKLIGVAGIDLLLKDINAIGGNESDNTYYESNVAPLLKDRSSTCYDLEMDDEMLESLRTIKCETVNSVAAAIIIPVSVVLFFGLIVLIIAIFIGFCTVSKCKRREKINHSPPDKKKKGNIIDNIENEIMELKDQQNKNKRISATNPEIESYTSPYSNFNPPPIVQNSQISNKENFVPPTIPDYVM